MELTLVNGLPCQGFGSLRSISWWFNIEFTSRLGAVRSQIPSSFPLWLKSHLFLVAFQPMVPCKEPFFDPPPYRLPGCPFSDPLLKVTDLLVKF